MLNNKQDITHKNSKTNQNKLRNIFILKKYKDRYPEIFNYKKK